MEDLNILTAIKPEYAEKIYEHTKTLEFRKRVSKQLYEHFIKNGNKKKVKMFIYESYPTKKITGYIMIDFVWKMNKKVIDILYKAHSESFGIDLKDLYKYYDISSMIHETDEVGVAIDIFDSVRFEKPISLWDIDMQYPPQDYRYLTPFDVEKLLRVLANC